jgi:uncharacterized membrane protein YjjP (DUF1212 family)
MLWAMTASAEPVDPLRVRRIMTVGLRTGAILLGSGSQTSDVEAVLRRMTRALGLPGVQAIVSFTAISMSWIAPGDLAPTTVIHLVRDRGSDFARLAAVARLSRSVIDGETDLDGAEAGLLTIEATGSGYPAWLLFLAPGTSGAATTILFGGNISEAVATLLIGLVVQPLVTRFDRSSIPPFFRIATAVLVTTLLVALVALLTLPITAGLVLTGGILRFLPGNALVSGVRDLIDQSIVSGTARVAEAILLAGAVATGAGIGVSLASGIGVPLGLTTAGTYPWGPIVGLLAAAVAVGAYGIRIGVPLFALPGAAAIGAVAGLVYQAVAPVNPVLATFVAATTIGVAGRVLANRARSPAGLWVVPAILVLLPGLAIVEALLASTSAGQVAGLVSAVGVAAALGVGVATGDIVVLTVERFRDRVVAPAVDVVHTGFDVLVVRPIERVTGPDARRRTSEPGTSAAPVDAVLDDVTVVDATGLDGEPSRVADRD